MTTKLFREDPQDLGIYAEQTFCKTCQVKDCQIFYKGDYTNCQPLVESFRKEIENYNALMKTLENKKTAGVSK